MRCDEFNERLQQVLDERREAERDELLQRHAAECPSCCRVLDGQTRLWDGMELWETPSLSDDFARLVVAQVSTRRAISDSPSTAPYSAWPLAATTALAAGLLLALVPATLFWNHSSDAPRPEQVVQVRAERTEAAAERLAAERRAAARLAIERTVAENSPNELLPERPLAGPDEAVAFAGAERLEYLLYHDEELREVLESVTRRISANTEPVDQIAGGLRPLANSFGVALDALRRTIVMGRDTRPQKPQADASSHDSVQA